MKTLFLESLDRPVLQLGAVMSERKPIAQYSTRYRRDTLIKAGITIGAVSQKAALFYGLTEKHLHKLSRVPRFSWPRQVAMALACELGHSHRRAARFFKLNRSSASHAIRAVRDICDVDSVVRDEVNEIRAALSTARK